MHHTAFGRALRAIGAGVLAVLTPGAGASVVYDNTVNPSGYFYPIVQGGQPDSIEIGDGATLAGSDRFVTQLSVWIYSGLDTGTANLRARLYVPDGPSGGPGTVLWDSGALAGRPYAAGFNEFDFAVPGVSVPGDIIWTFQITGRTAAAERMGTLMYDPPVVGASADFFWARDLPGFPGWNALHFVGNNPIANFEARITAVPGPAGAAGLAAGVVLVGRRRRGAAAKPSA